MDDNYESMQIFTARLRLERAARCVAEDDCGSTRDELERAIRAYRNARAMPARESAAQVFDLSVEEFDEEASTADWLELGGEQ